MKSIALDPTAHLFIVAPHPDDEVLSFGGALREHVLGGGSSTVIAVTDGEAADDSADAGMRRSLAAQRAVERTEALRQLGVFGPDVVRLRLRDGHVADDERRLTRDLHEILAAAVRGASSPPIVVAPWRFDLHPDHEASGRATWRASEDLPLRYLEVPIWAWYEAHRRSLTGNELCEGAVLISAETRRAKRKAMSCFTSQLSVMPSGRGPVLPQGFVTAFDRGYEPVFV